MMRGSHLQLLNSLPSCDAGGLLSSVCQALEIGHSDEALQIQPCQLFLRNVSSLLSLKRALAHGRMRSQVKASYIS